MANNSHQQSLTVTTVMGNARCLSAYKQAAIQIFCKGMPMAYPGCWKFPQVDLQKTLPGCGSAGQQLASKFSEALLESLARLLRCASPSMLSAAIAMLVLAPSACTLSETLRSEMGLSCAKARPTFSGRHDPSLFARTPP